jgi:hypothetical protein
MPGRPVQRRHLAGRRGRGRLGLIDGVAHLKPKLMQLYGDKVRLVAYGQKRSLLQRFGMSAVDSALGAVEDRALWARYGL